MRTLGFVLICLLLFGVVWFGVSFIKGKAQYQIDKETWETEKAGLQKNIDKLGREIKAEEQKAVDALARADEWAEKAEEIEKQLSTERLEFARRLEAIATMAPDQLVLAHHFHLSVDSTQVWLNKMGLQFTLDAARVNLKFLDERQFYLKTEKPGLESLITVKDNRIGELNISNTSLTSANLNLHLENTDLKVQVKGEYTLRLKAERLIRFKLFSTETAIGAAIGLVLGVVISALF